MSLPFCEAASLREHTLSLQSGCLCLPQVPAPDPDSLGVGLWKGDLRNGIPSGPCERRLDSCPVPSSQWEHLSEKVPSLNQEVSSYWPRSLSHLDPDLPASRTMQETSALEVAPSSAVFVTEARTDEENHTRTQLSVFQTCMELKKNSLRKKATRPSRCEEQAVRKPLPVGPTVHGGSARRSVPCASGGWGLLPLLLLC